ncbi:MAG TPA: sigma-70 family RNA polymerase sigma factor [Candidatus Adamsella sp.]|nr:sigma-70 family RNA polymerase sigma factor [Candidatus Adamsella sp.]
MKNPREYFQKNKYKNSDTSDLVINAQRGDNLAMEELIRRHENYIYMRLYQLDPQNENIKDLMQDVMLRVARSLKNLKNPRRFQSWLSQIITNIFFDELRKKRRKLNTVSLDSFFSEEEESSKTEKELECPKDSPDKCSENSEMKRIIRRAISELEEPYRAVIMLRELQGFSYDEIASATGASVGTVKSRIARARQKLQTKLKDYLQ